MVFGGILMLIEVQQVLSWPAMRGFITFLCGACCVILNSNSVVAHEVYVMNSNHTDYNWNAPAAEYDAAMLAELDYYLQQIADTAGAPAEEQARYTPDNWWWMYLYEHNRTPEEFAELLDAIRSGHITIPLNPFVTLYGALPTEAAIRAGYYPGRIARRHGLEFLLAENIENHTSPWGLASIWAGSAVEYTWKGVCGCVQSAPSRFDDELFIWQGPDNKTLLFKWYNLVGNNRDWGGYSEARDNLSSPGQIDAEIARTETRMPGIPFTGLFGAGWDDVSWQSNAVIDAVAAYNASGTGDTAVVSNGIDFFQALEAAGVPSQLNIHRGGWGNDWDMWPASLAERTSRTRRAIERMRTAETLAVWAELHQPGFWGPVRDTLESGLMSVWKYFEHGWDVTAGGPSLTQMQADKESWAQDIENAVDGAITEAEITIPGIFTTPNEDRLAVFNPLAFSRTDYAEIEAPGAGPFIVTDVATGLEVPSQLHSRDGTTYLRFLASSVPSLGYRVYRYQAGTPAGWEDAATVSTASRTIENDRYRVVLGPRGQIVEATDKVSIPSVQMAGSNGMNDYGTGTIQSVTAENVGPVSATLRVDLTGPARTVRITLYVDIERIDIDNAITENETGLQTYGFHANLSGAQIRFEEIGAIARPGMVADGGDFLPGTRASRMTLNHFVDFEKDGYHIVLSNRDAYSMQVNNSTNSTFDLTGDEVKVVVMEQALGAGTSNQGGDSLFINRFALRGVDADFDAAEAMRTSLAHQNPLHVIGLPRNQTGPLESPTASLLSLSSDQVVVTAFKPAEDPGHGFVVRIWELGGQSRSLNIDASTMNTNTASHASLVETDISSAAVTSGVISTSVDANEITTLRFTDGPIFADGLETGDLSAWAAAIY
jgi:alpha-mannosidase